MGRLIDEDMLIEEIEKIALEVGQQTQGRKNGKTLAQGILFGFGAMRKTVLEQPTAYDPDKVVVQLENLKTINVDIGFGTTVSTLRKDVVMEIVKAGGTDGN
nr:MAG TPA: hypothetical protein [Caudoviricetes sp.]